MVTIAVFITHLSLICFARGSALSRRLKEREKEMEADSRDRQREKEEIEEIRRRLMDEGHPELEMEMARVSMETIIAFKLD